MRNIAKVQRHVKLLKTGCGCKKDCSTRNCGCRKAGRYCNENYKKCRSQCVNRQTAVPAQVESATGTGDVEEDRRGG